MHITSYLWAVALFNVKKNIINSNFKGFIRELNELICKNYSELHLPENKHFHVLAVITIIIVIIIIITST